MIKIQNHVTVLVLFQLTTKRAPKVNSANQVSKVPKVIPATGDQTVHQEEMVVPVTKDLEDSLAKKVIEVNLVLKVNVVSKV